MWNHFLSHFNSADPFTFHMVYPCARCNQIPRPPNFDILNPNQAFPVQPTANPNRAYTQCNLLLIRIEPIPNATYY